MSHMAVWYHQHYNIFTMNQMKNMLDIDIINVIKNLLVRTRRKVFCHPSSSSSYLCENLPGTANHKTFVNDVGLNFYVDYYGIPYWNPGLDLRYFHTTIIYNKVTKDIVDIIFGYHTNGGMIFFSYIDKDLPYITDTPCGFTLSSDTDYKIYYSKFLNKPLYNSRSDVCGNYREDCYTDMVYFVEI